MLSKADLTAATLASVLEQSVDCVKLVGLDGKVLWMNANGLCAMEIDELCAVENMQWTDLWPQEARAQITAGLTSAAVGNVARFEAFCPTAKGTPRWWNVCISRVENANEDHVGYLTISRDITEMAMARQALEITAEEMQHRIKNTYAMIGGLMMGYANGNVERTVFAREMNDRLVAISKAQTLFASSQAPCDLAALIPALVVPFDSARCAVTVAETPAILVSQGRADAIALVLGELCVNATKHGALSAGGSIRVDASADAAGFRIIWHEQSSKPVTAKARKGGQGLKLISNIVRARGGTLDIIWHDHGPTVTLEFPN